MSIKKPFKVVYLLDCLDPELPLKSFLGDMDFFDYLEILEGQNWELKCPGWCNNFTTFI